MAGAFNEGLDPGRYGGMFDAFEGHCDRAGHDESAIDHGDAHPAAMGDREGAEVRPANLLLYNLLRIGAGGAGCRPGCPKDYSTTRA